MSSTVSISRIYGKILEFLDKRYAVKGCTKFPVTCVDGFSPIENLL